MLSITARLRRIALDEKEARTGQEPVDGGSLSSRTADGRTDGQARCRALPADCRVGYRSRGRDCVFAAARRRQLHARLGRRH